MNADSWGELLRVARESARYTGQRRYIIGHRWELSARHGWTYHVLTAEEYIKHRAQRHHPRHAREQDS